MTKKYTFNGNTILFDEELVLKANGASEKLKKNQVTLLNVLIEAQPNFVTGEEIKNHVWGHAFISNESVTQLVKQTRDAIGDDNKSAIINQKGKGYTIANVLEYQDAEPVVTQPESEATTDDERITEIKSQTKRSILTSSYLYISIVCWVISWGLFFNSESKEVFLKDILEINELSFVISNSSHELINISDGVTTCVLNTLDKEATCEVNE